MRAALKNIDEAERALSKNDCPKAQLAYTKLLQNDDINTLLKTNDDKNALACAKRTQQDADNSVMLAAALPDQIDPPVDSILHSVNFVITYGANISPNWTLLQWRGPSPANGSLAGTTGIKTNTMVLSLGPRTGSTASPDALRLIQNQTVRALSN